MPNGFYYCGGVYVCTLSQWRDIENGSKGTDLQIFDISAGYDSYLEIPTEDIFKWENSGYYNGYIITDNGNGVILILDPKSGEVIQRINTGLDLGNNRNWQIVKDNKAYYMLVSKEANKYNAYRIYLPV